MADDPQSFIDRIRAAGKEITDRIPEIKRTTVTILGKGEPGGEEAIPAGRGTTETGRLAPEVEEALRTPVAAPVEEYKPAGGEQAAAGTQRTGRGQATGAMGQRSEAGIPNLAPSSGPIGEPIISNSPRDIDEGSQPLGPQASTPSGPPPEATSLNAPPSTKAGPAMTRLPEDFKVGSIDPSSGRIVLQPTDDVNALLRTAKAEQPNFEEMLSKATADVPGAVFLAARTKGDARLKEKLQATPPVPPQTISDYLGARVEVPTFAAADQVLDKLASMGASVVMDDEVAKQRLGGYIARHVQVKLPSGMSAEIQFAPEEVHSIQEPLHADYEIVRSPNSSPEQKGAALSRLRQGFGTATAAYQARTGDVVARNLHPGELMSSPEHGTDITWGAAPRAPVVGPYAIEQVPIGDLISLGARNEGKIEEERRQLLGTAGLSPSEAPEPVQAIRLSSPWGGRRILVVDGARRLAALRKLGYTDSDKIPVAVVTNWHTPEFLDLIQQKDAMAPEKFKKWPREVQDYVRRATEKPSESVRAAPASTMEQQEEIRAFEKTMTARQRSAYLGFLERGYSREDARRLAKGQPALGVPFVPQPRAPKSFKGSSPSEVLAAIRSAAADNDDYQFKTKDLKYQGSAIDKEGVKWHIATGLVDEPEFEGTGDDFDFWAAVPQEKDGTLGAPEITVRPEPGQNRVAAEAANEAAYADFAARFAPGTLPPPFSEEKPLAPTPDANT